MSKCENCGEKEATTEIYLSDEVDGQAIDCVIDVCEECERKLKNLPPNP